MPELNENQAIIDVAQEAVGAQQLEHGIYYDGVKGEIVDIRSRLHQEAQRVPDRKTGTYTVTDVPSFAGYLAKHGQEHTEVWGSRDKGNVRAVIDAPGSGAYDANHREHSVTLQLRHSDDWNDWTQRNGQWMSQVDFAEFVEDHLVNFGRPTGAEALELAQSFRATQKVEFGATKHAGGETTLSYVESTDAKAGKKGDIVFPDKVTLGVHVYDQGKAYQIDARLRYRVRGGELLMGYKLDRPKDVLQTAFDHVVADVQAETGRDVWATL